PAITIIGKVVTMRDTIIWFETRPLFGHTIVVTRTRQQASDLTRQLQELGANVIEAPTIELQPVADWTKVDNALGVNVAMAQASSQPLAPSRHPQWDWVIFT